MATAIIATTLAEKQQIYQFRYQVYVEEMQKQPRTANHQAKLLSDHLDETATLLYMTHENQIIATLRRNIIDASSLSSLPASLDHIFAVSQFAAAFPQARFSLSSRLMVAPAWRNSTTLGALISEAYRAAREQGILFDFLHAAPWLLAFYRTLGYRCYTNHFLDPEVGLQIPQVLVMEDLEHLKLMRSPFYRIARRYSNSSTTRDWLLQLLASQRLAETPSEGLSQLAAAPIFQGLSQPEIQQIWEASVVHAIQPDETIVRIGDPANAMFLILSGAVAVSHLGNADRSQLAAYQTFGEANLFNPLSSEHATALTHTELLILPKPTLCKLMKVVPNAMCRLLYSASRSICERYVPIANRSLVSEATV